MQGPSLFPDNLRWNGVASELRHPGESLLVLQIHPVAHPRSYADKVLVALGILLLQPVELLAILHPYPIAIEGTVVGTHLQGEGHITKRQQ